MNGVNFDIQISFILEIIDFNKIANLYSYFSKIKKFLQSENLYS